MRSRASALSGARPRLVWSTTPVALITGRSENAPWRPSCSRTRPTRAAASGGSASPLSTRLRSASRTSRTSAVSRGRGTARASDRSPTSRSTWSTAGSRRRRAARSALIEGRLHLFADPSDDVLGLAPPRLGRPARFASLAGTAHGVFGKPGPQLVEIRAGQALASKRARPLGSERFDEPVALASEAPRLAHEIGQSRRYAAHSFTESRRTSTRLASNRPVDAQL